MSRRRIVERWSVAGGTVVIWSHASGYWAKRTTPVESWLSRGSWLWFGDDLEGAVAWLAKEEGRLPLDSLDYSTHE